jgi:phosphoribosyl 1,2-cyclic phosphate phosphodiesterase
VKLTFLGTGAAEGYPALWCRCERCLIARERGGRNLRFRSSLLINDDLLLDPGPDTVAAGVRLCVDFAAVQAALVTHPHTDHLEPSTFFWRRKGFVGTPLPMMDVYASGASIARLTQREGRTVDPGPLQLRMRQIGAFQRFSVSTGDAAPDPRFEDRAAETPTTPRRTYDVWTFGANHAEPQMEPVIFAIRQTTGPEAEGRAAPATLFYATDTGPFSDETWAALDTLRAEGVTFAASAIDSTLGLGADGKAHMTIRQMAAHQEMLAERGAFALGARRFAHHFSHNGTPPYEELSALLAPQGIESSYDGLVVDL